MGRGDGRTWIKKRVRLKSSTNSNCCFDSRNSCLANFGRMGRLLLPIPHTVICFRIVASFSGLGNNITTQSRMESCQTRSMGLLECHDLFT